MFKESHLLALGDCLKLSIFVDALWPQLEITPKTLSNYKGAYSRYIDTPLGNTEILELQKTEILDILATLPAQTRYQTFMVLRVILREAMARQLIDENPLIGIRTPKVTVQPSKFLKWEELKEIDFGYHTKRIHFLALHGLRYGEAAALTIDDIHDGRVFITKSKWGATKTTAGIRSVPQMCDFVEFPIYQDRIAKVLRPYGVTVHSLRKTYAYILKQSNVHVTTAAKLMGHSNPLVTLKIYTQVLDNEIDDSGADIKAFLRNRGGGGY